MLCRIVLFSPEDWSDLIDLLKSCCHHHLFIELRALVEKCFFVKVGDREQFGSAFRCSGDDLWGSDIDESLVMQELVDGVHRGTADLEDSSNPWSAGIEEAGVEPGVEIGWYLLHNVKGQRAVSHADNLKNIRNEFASARCLVNRFYHTGNADNRFPGDLLYGGKYCL